MTLDLVVTLGFVLATLLAATATLLKAWSRARRRASDLAAQLQQAQQVQAEQLQLLRRRDELASAKDDFIANVSHELRTPLTSIRGALGLLSAGVHGSMDSKAQNLLRIASTNTDRLARLINDVLDLERMEAGFASLQLQRCSMWQLAIQAMDAMSPMAQSAGVSMEVIPVADDTSVAFDGDSDRILQVLCNLISNAIKFSPAGATVRIHCSAEAGNLLLRVEDQGRGIPVDKLEAIFGRFQQVDRADARQKGGTGLGLAICRSIALQHGGTIWAERNEDKHAGNTGASLIMRLPRLASESIEPEAASSPLGSTEAATVEPRTPELETLTSVFA